IESNDSHDDDTKADLAFLLNGRLVRTWSLPEIFALVPKPAQKRKTAESLEEKTDPTAKLLEELEAENRKRDEQWERERIWRYDGTIPRFEQIGGTTVFCLWFAGYDQWLGWNVTNGASVKLPDSVRTEL